MISISDHIPNWLEHHRQQLICDTGSLPAGLMLLGPTGSGKLSLGLNLCAILFCEKPDGGESCGKCSGCQSFSAGTHPDFHLITTEKNVDTLDKSLQGYASRYLQQKEKRSTSRKSGQQIGVDQIRSVIERLSTHAYMGGERIVLIAPADALNTNSANALLKILEEPHAGCRFILLCSGRDKLPATVFSRVTVFNVSPPPIDEAANWLLDNGVPQQYTYQLVSLAAGAPLLAHRYFLEGWCDKIPIWEKVIYQLGNGKLEPVAAAKIIGVDNGPDFLFWLEGLCSALISLKHGRQNIQSVSQNKQFISLLLDKLYSVELWDMIRKLRRYRHFQQRVVDELLFLEDVLIAIWQKN